jgi:CBS-domain-containing membrane protein
MTTIGTRVWLDREIIGPPDGAMHLRGTMGHEAVVAAVDGSIFRDWPVAERHARLLALHRQFESAAERNFALGRSARVHEYHSPNFKHHLIAVTDCDLLEAEGALTPKKP